MWKGLRVLVQHSAGSGPLLKEQSDGKTEKSEEMLLDLPNEHLHHVMKASDPEEVLSQHSWAIEAYVDVDWLGSLGIVKQVVRLCTTCRCFGEANKTLLGGFGAQRRQQNPKD